MSPSHLPIPSYSYPALRTACIHPLGALLCSAVLLVSCGGGEPDGDGGGAGSSSKRGPAANGAQQQGASNAGAASNRLGGGPSAAGKRERPARTVIKLLPDISRPIEGEFGPDLPAVQAGVWFTKRGVLEKVDRLRRNGSLMRKEHSLIYRASRRSIVLRGDKKDPWRSGEVVIPEQAKLDFSTMVYLPNLGSRLIQLNWSIHFAPSGGGKRTEIWSSSEFLKPPTGGGWRSSTVDLSSIAGQSGQFVFRSNGSEDSPSKVPMELLAAFGNPVVYVPNDTRPNVLIISIDTLRRDRISPYGGDPQLTPNLGALAASGITIERYWSAAPWTLPSYATLMTGEYPSTHGAGRVQLEEGGSTRGVVGIADGIPSLVRNFDQAGYATQAFFSNGHLNMPSGVENGFDGYNWYGLTGRSATQQFHEWTATLNGRPFFAMVQMTDPHWPLVVPTRFQPIQEAPDPDSVPSLETDAMRLFHKGVPEEDRDHFTRLYEVLVEYMDARVGEVLSSLEKRGLRENTLIVFHSDHGEELWDHGNWWHGHTYHHELVQVPLIFSFPNVLPAGTRIDGDFRGPDVMPTLLDLVGLWPIERELEGVSLAHLLTGEDGNPPAPALHESQLYGPGGDLALTAWPWRLIYQPVGDRQANDSYVNVKSEVQLFNVEDDPLELVNLADKEPKQRDKMLAAARKFQEQAASRKLGKSTPTKMGADADAGLSVLGYVEDE